MEQMASREENTPATSSKSTASTQKKRERQEALVELEAQNSQLKNELQNLNEELKQSKDHIMEDLSQLFGLPISDIKAILPEFQGARNSDEQTTSSEREQTERKELKTLEALAKLQAKNSQLKSALQNLDEKYRELREENNRLKRDLAQAYGLEYPDIAANVPDFHGARNSDEHTNSSEKEPTGGAGPNVQPRDNL